MKLLQKVPDKSEIDTLAIFWKLEALDLLPFAKFVTWEHTNKDGIDVIASFQIDDESASENFVPVEFEYSFENFMSHGHNPKQTKCTICWMIQNPSILRKINEYLYFYDAEGVSIPVYQIEQFPGLQKVRYPELDL